MPRPDSKIMQAGVLGGTSVADAPSDTSSNATTLVKKARAKKGGLEVQNGAVTNSAVKPAKLTPEQKAAEKQAAADAKAELVKKKADLKAALGQARGPLDGIEAQLKATEKDALTVQRTYDRAAADRDKAVKALAKQTAGLEAKRVKFTAQFDKAKAKIDAQLAKLG